MFPFNSELWSVLVFDTSYQVSVLKGLLGLLWLLSRLTTLPMTKGPRGWQSWAILCSQITPRNISVHMWAYACGHIIWTNICGHLYVWHIYIILNDKKYRIIDRLAWSWDSNLGAKVHVQLLQHFHHCIPARKVKFQCTTPQKKSKKQCATI